MAKDKKQAAPKSNEHKAAVKKARTEANKAKRAHRHAVRMAKQDAKGPVARGKARALRREGMKQQQKIKVLPTVVLNGQLMTTEQAALEAKRLLQRRKQEQAANDSQIALAA